MSPANPVSPEEYQALLLAMQDVLGVVVTEEKRDLISDRLGGVMQKHAISSLSELASRMRESHNGLNTQVLEALSAHDSGWSSHPELTRLLNMYILPSAADSAKKKFRIWVTGCGRGQLAYAVAMQIAEYKQSHSLNTVFEIVATDISATDIAQADNGRYEESMLDGLSSAYQKKYLKPDEGAWTVNPAIRNMVKFSTRDLLRPFTVMGHFDLVICTDVLIYFSASIRRQILDEFSRLLDPSGILIVGSSESVVQFSQSYERVAHEAGVFYRQLPH